MALSNNGRIRVNVTGARGALGIDLQGTPAAGQYLVKGAGGGRSFVAITPATSIANAVPLTGLAANNGTNLVGYGGQSLTQRLQVQNFVTDTRFAGGAKGDGVYTASSDTVSGTDDTAAIQAALNAGGRVVFPGPNRIYRVTNRLLVTVPGTWVELEAGVQIIGMPWRKPAGQDPFGSLLLITADNCTVTGASEHSSGFRVLSPSEANGVTFLHCGGVTARNFFVKYKAGAGAPISDDTFQTGLHVLNATGGNANGTLSNALIENVVSEGFVQYGFQFYGDLSGGIMRGCTGTLAGILSNPSSRGSGIAITRGVRNLLVADNNFSNNKEYAVLLSSAGLDSYNITFSENRIADNGRGGISGTEEANLASVAGQGMSRIKVKDNRFIGNGKNSSFTSGRAAIRFGTFDNVGYIKGYECTNNYFEDNVDYNEIYQSNASNGVFDGGKSFGNVSDINANTQYAFAIGSGVKNFLHSNFYNGNQSKKITDAQYYWTEFDLTAGWSLALGEPFKKSGYMIEPDGHVALRLNTQNGSNGEVAYTMPEGYRPSTTVVFSDGANRFYIRPDGALIFSIGSGPILTTVRYLPYA